MPVRRNGDECVGPHQKGRGEGRSERPTAALKRNATNWKGPGSIRSGVCPLKGLLYPGQTKRGTKKVDDIDKVPKEGATHQGERPVASAEDVFRGKGGGRGRRMKLHGYLTNTHLNMRNTHSERGGSGERESDLHMKAGTI